MKNLYHLLVFIFILNHALVLAQNERQRIFYDEFNENRNNWDTRNIEDQTSNSIADGYYYIEGLQKKQALMKLYPILIDENKNFEIEASIKKITAAKKNGYGIVFGFLDIENYFRFTINDKGSFKFYKKKDGKREKIIPWTESEYINQGIGTTNKLTIKKVGDEIKLYSNDNLIAIIPFQSFFGNMIGFYVQREQKIAIDYLRISYINE